MKYAVIICNLQLNYVTLCYMADSPQHAYAMHMLVLCYDSPNYWLLLGPLQFPEVSVPMYPR